MSAKLRYSRTKMIKLWRQHLGAQLPGALSQPLNVRRHQEQCSRHKTIRTIPRYPRDPNFFCEIWEEKSQNSTSGYLTRAMKRLGSKKNSETLRYIIPKWLKTFFPRHISAAKNDQAMGLLRSGYALIPTCNALDAAISPTCRSTT